MLLEVCVARQYEKELGKFVFYREGNLFIKVASIDVLGPEEKFLQLEQVLLY